MRLRLERWISPLAPLRVVTDQDGLLRAVEFADLENRLEQRLRRYAGPYTLEDGPAPTSLIHALEAYFQGEMEALDDIQTAPGGTAFQRAVWNALPKIPIGTTVTYGQLAANLGRPAAARAVGTASGANPIPIVIPCHRVIGADGALTGFGGGLERKRWLLNHEKRFASDSLFTEQAAGGRG